jgi:hypothetical protein
MIQGHGNYLVQLIKTGLFPQWPRICCPSRLFRLGAFQQTTQGAFIMDQDNQRERSQTGWWWNELTILRAILLVSSILFLVLAFNWQ